MHHVSLFAALDQDKDGKISNDEIKNSADTLRTLDGNHDDTLTADELRPNFAGTRFGQGTSPRFSPMLRRGRSGWGRPMPFRMWPGRDFGRRPRNMALATRLRAAAVRASKS